MQELEKILEEIEKLKEMYKESAFSLIDKGNLPCEYDKSDIESAKVQAISEAITIIRKHMNDGWIPVEDRPPEKNEYFVETSSDKDFPNGYYKRLEIAYMTDTIEYVHGYYDGYKWMDKYLDTIKNVVAWRIHEPYRPERSDDHDGE